MQLSPMTLMKVPEAFDHLDWLFELKVDGFGFSRTLRGITAS
jgi:hypothetical protein